MQANLISAIDYIQQSQAYKVVMANTNKTNIAIVAASTVLIAAGVFFGKRIEKRVQQFDTKFTEYFKLSAVPLSRNGFIRFATFGIRCLLTASGGALLVGRVYYLGLNK